MGHCLKGKALLCRMKNLIEMLLHIICAWPFLVLPWNIALLEKTMIRIRFSTFVPALLCVGLQAAEMPDHAIVKKHLQAVVKESDGGFRLNMWATLVDRDGVARLAPFSGAGRGDQWPGSRVISAQNASAANAFSLPLYAKGGKLLGALGGERRQFLRRSHHRLEAAPCAGAGLPARRRQPRQGRQYRL